jgi:hypothetical protein
MQCSSMHAWWWCQMMWLMPKIFARPCCGGFIACLCARANDFAVCLMSSCSSIHARRPAGCYTRRAAALSAAPQPRRAFARIMHDWEGNWWAEWPSSSTISLCDGGRIPRHAVSRERDISAPCWSPSRSSMMRQKSPRPQAAAPTVARRVLACTCLL